MDAQNMDRIERKILCIFGPARQLWSVSVIYEKLFEELGKLAINVKLFANWSQDGHRNLFFFFVLVQRDSQLTRSLSG